MSSSGEQFETGDKVLVTLPPDASSWKFWAPMMAKCDGHVFTISLVSFPARQLALLQSRSVAGEDYYFPKEWLSHACLDDIKETTQEVDNELFW